MRANEWDEGKFIKSSITIMRYLKQLTYKDQRFRTGDPRPRLDSNGSGPLVRVAYCGGSVWQSQEAERGPE